MDKLIVDADKEILVDLVRLAQKRGLQGSSGVWKDFLNSYDKKFGAGLSDPAKRSSEILVAFLETFTNEEDLKFFGTMIRRYQDQKALERYMKEFPDQESPQQRLVRLTIQHPEYVRHYSFPSINQEWIITPLGKLSEAMKSNSMIAIDCEMVLCEDGSDAVVRVCAVDHTLEVKVDQYVKPNNAIVDYRTSITGISAKDLEGVTCSLFDIQKLLQKLLAHGTILVGHSLHNDLRALKIYHPRVIDTSSIFKYEDFPASYTPSLNSLCKSVLGIEVRRDGEPHNCLSDAQAAMKLVLAKLECGLNDPIVVAGQKVPEGDLAKLLIHKIPHDVPKQELLNLLSGDYNIVNKNDKQDVVKKYFSTFAVFKNIREANEAFETLEGQEDKDTHGRLQKRSTLQLSSGKIVSLCVRKMSIEQPVGNNDSSKKRPAEKEFNESKKRRMCLNNCGHVEEIEKLKQLLQQREEEIFNLQKVVFALTRGGGHGSGWFG